MKRLLMAFVVMIGLMARADGFIVTFENDIFTGSDNNYSAGTELEWVSEPKMDEDGPFRIGYGANELMYTPTDAQDVKMPPPYDHPWCGTLSAYRETWTRSGRNETRMRYEVGVLGPLASAKFFQSSIHRMINNDLPKGWSNQLPNEPMLNYYYDTYHLFWNESVNHWRIDFKGIYGGTAGTTFDNARGGLQIRMGYNIPRNSMPGGIDPKAGKPGVEDDQPGFFAYFTTMAQGMVVARDATVGESLLRTRKSGQDRILEPLVGEYHYGVVVGYRELSLTYVLCHRTNEFRNETDGGTDWGMVRLEFLHQF